MNSVRKTSNQIRNPEGEEVGRNTNNNNEKSEELWLGMRAIGSKSVKKFGFPPKITRRIEGQSS
jgi:hypothetical protein